MPPIRSNYRFLACVDSSPSKSFPIHDLYPPLLTHLFWFQKHTGMSLHKQRSILNLTASALEPPRCYDASSPGSTVTAFNAGERTGQNVASEEHDAKETALPPPIAARIPTHGPTVVTNGVGTPYNASYQNLRYATHTTNGVPQAAGCLPRCRLTGHIGNIYWGRKSCAPVRMFEHETIFPVM